MKSQQELICVNKQGWEDHETGAPKPGPKYGDVVTFRQFDPTDADYIVLEEHIGDPSDPNSWKLTDNFVPVADISELKEILEAAPFEI